MASHAGLIIAIKSSKGYLKGDGTFTDEVRDARLIRGLEFGFSSASKIAKELGCMDDIDFSFETLEPSYDSRLGMMESFFHDLGMDYYASYDKAANLFNRYGLYDYTKFKEFLPKLEHEVAQTLSKSYAKDILKMDDKSIVLYPSKRKPLNTQEYIEEILYSNDKRYTRYTFSLPNPDVQKYFVLNNKEVEYYNGWQINGLIDYLKDKFKDKSSIASIGIKDDKLVVYFEGCDYDLTCKLSDSIQEYLSNREMHITRMFGSYILLQRIDGKLKAVLATPIPIKYCPLMIKLLKEVGGDVASDLIKSLENSNEEEQKKLMCKLIDEVVIDGGYFDTNRALNSCEANVLFGASETISSAFTNKLIDAAVIVSNNLGTIITTNAPSTQGAVKRMTGLFYTSPNKTLVMEADKERIIPVFPYSAKIDQLEGVKLAIKKGYKKIAVTVAANDNDLLEKFKELEEENGITIYKFGLCSTGIKEHTADIMKDNADVVWSCASKYVKEKIAPSSIMQVGLKIPVHVMTNQGWKIVKNHLECMDSDFTYSDEVEEKKVILNSQGKMKVLSLKEVHKCGDCPHPCI